ncbi:MAG TPA: ABC transporter ATP-binding protein [Spirochaetota bacterium]|nr:ABC transporter ATP-binding protein [Spirochaetota bacterium]HOM38786.1 ABC transporter ATP-binding protein [Spirochaetota bacterium]HPQ49844.1 ABC transporter ATP-binding protein [Spirochaetota bacterium]
MYSIQLNNVTKIFKLYRKPKDKLKELFHPLGKKYHNDFVALSDITFKVKKGENIAILGKNGAGKSTLLKIISKVTYPTYGYVETRGRISALLELTAGFNYEIDAIENIYFYGALLGIRKKEMSRLIDSIIEFAEISDYVTQPLKYYSSGMLAKLAFSVATVIKPEILIVDEVLSVGDAAFREKSLKRMREMFANEDITILYVSHDIDTVKNLCNRAIILDKGRLVKDGDVKEICDYYIEKYSYTNS